MLSAAKILGLALFVMAANPAVSLASALTGETFRWHGSRFNGGFGCNMVPNEMGYQAFAGNAAGPVDGNFREDGLVTLNGGRVIRWQAHFTITDRSTGAVLVSGDTSLSAGGPGTCTSGVTGASGDASATLSYIATIYDAFGNPRGAASGISVVRLSYKMANDAVTGSSFAEGFDTMTFTGQVFLNSVAQPVAGALVQLCPLPSGPCLPTQTAASDGSFRFDVPDFGEYRVRADPPAGMTLIPRARRIQIDGNTVKNIFLNAPISPPAGTTITNRGTNPDGLPIVYWLDPSTLTTTGCSGGSATYDLQLTSELGGFIRSGAMTEGPSGTYTASITALNPNKGYAQVHISLTCAGSTSYVSFDIYIDPSGTVRTATGDPVAGAMVTLLRADTENGPFTPLPPGSAMMSIANRENPDLTDASGHFGWDVVAGFYQVRAEHGGCVAATDPTQSFVLSEAFQVPPALSDLDLRLLCGTRDSTPPITTATAQPSANAHGWNSGDVTITLLAADDAGGSGVREIRYALTSGSASDARVVSGSSASLLVTAEGTNILDYFASDNAGNSEAVHRLVVLIDHTPPAVAGAQQPPPNANGWNNTPVTARFQANDALSGIDGTSTFDATVASEGANQFASHTFLDLAGNSASATAGPINLDFTAPSTKMVATPTATASGWWRSSLSVALAATDNLSGVATTSFQLDGASWNTYSTPIAVNGEGNHSLLFRSIDAAGNEEKAASVTLPIDLNPPEAFLRLDPIAQDLVLFGRDALSGFAPGSLHETPSGIAPESVVPIHWDDEDHDDSNREAAGHLNAQLRTYRVTDQAGNTFLLAAKVKPGHAELNARVVSLRYNDGPLMLAPANRLSFEWSLSNDGSIKQLGQKLKVGAEGASTEIEAHYSARRNATTIEIERPEQRIERTGLVFLHLATAAGALVVEY